MSYGCGGRPLPFEAPATYIDVTRVHGVTVFVSSYANFPANVNRKLTKKFLDFIT